MERTVLTLWKQNRSKTAETICILTTENCLWLLLGVGEVNIQFTGFTRSCHCSQLPELKKNDTKMNAFIRRLLSEVLNGIIFHKAKCLLTLGKRCWSCWKVKTSGVYDGTAGEGPTGVSATDKCARDRKGCF